MNPAGQKAGCIFCRIAAGDLPSEKVLETDKVLAFRDMNPGAPQHVLLIPKNHIADSVADLVVTDSDVAQTWVDLLSVAQQIAASSPDFADGWRLVTNVGENGGQSVFHLHVHLLGGRHMTWPPG
jgi:histidine triad (HIT) family protein